MTLLVLEELNLLLSLLNLNFLPLLISFLDGINLRFEFLNLVLQFRLLALQLLNGFLKISLTMLSLQLLSHRKSHRALVECLIRRNRHFDFISDSQKEQASLWLTQSDLPNYLIEALREEFLSHGADATLPGLSLHELLVEHLSEPGDVDSGGRLVTHVLDVVLARFDPFSWRENGIQNVLTTWLGAVHWWELLLFGACEVAIMR